MNVGEESIEGLYRRYGPLVLRRSRALLGNEEAAWDAMQEVFLRAMQKGASFRKEASPTSWLYRITTNYCLNLLRDSGRRARLLQENACSAAAPDRAWSAFALGGVRGDLLNLGPLFRGDLGLRLDIRPVSLELRFGSGVSWHRNQWLATTSREAGFSVAALHVFDVDAWSVGLGLELGAAWFFQHLDDARSRDRNALAALVAPVVQVEVPFGRAMYVRLDGAFLSYFLPTGAPADSSVRASYRVGAGGGTYF